MSIELRWLSTGIWLLIGLGCSERRPIEAAVEVDKGLDVALCCGGRSELKASSIAKLLEHLP